MPGTEFSKVETGPAGPERAVESAEAGSTFEAPKSRETSTEGAASPLPPRAVSSVPSGPAKDPVMVRVESVMEEGMKAAFLSMPENLRKRFKAHGETVANQVAEMIRKLKVVPAKVLELIRGWLKLIPGVNKFFLIQEAKIKTDKILALAEEEKKRRGAI